VCVCVCVCVVQVVVVVCRHEIRAGRSGVTYSLCTMVTMVFYDIQENMQLT